MAKIIQLTHEELASPANAFFAVGDHQNFRSETSTTPFGMLELRNQLHFYLLFCGKLTLVAEDLVLNEYLMQLLLRPEYRVLFSDGIFIPLIRSQYHSLADMNNFLREPDLYNPVDISVWQPSLDQLVSQNLYTATFDEDEAYSNFTELAQHYLLNPTFMEKYKAGHIVQPLSKRIDQLRHQANRKEFRRSLFFHYAAELGRARQKRVAKVIRHLSSVLYNAQFCGLFRQMPAFPSWYGRYLAGTTGIAFPDVDGMSFTEFKSINLEYLSPQIKPEAGLVSIEDILEIRNSSEFRVYLEFLEALDLQKGVAQSDEISFVSALEHYVRFLDQRFGEILSQRYPRKKTLTQNLRFIRGASWVGVFISLGSWGASLAGLPISLFTAPALGALTLGFLLYRNKAEKNIKGLEIETSQFWLERCTPGKTFAATLTHCASKVHAKLAQTNQDH